MIWVKHPKYNIEVSETGLIRGPRGVRAPRTDRYGYLRINMTVAGKSVTKTVHRLVADCFSLPGEGETVDHIDGDKTNNAVSNLQYMPAGLNCSKSFTQGLRTNVCHQVTIGNNSYHSKREAERQTGISRRSYP